MALAPEKAVTITLSTIALHNMLRTQRRALYTDEASLDRETPDGSIIEGNLFADHFYGPGAIPWQWNMLV